VTRRREFGSSPARVSDPRTEIHIAARRPGTQRSDGRMSLRAIVLHPYAKTAQPDYESRSAQARLAEATGLAEAIDLEVVEGICLPVEIRRPATYLGRGKCEEIAQKVADHGAGLVIFDGDLSPAQQRNLERVFSAKVIDRTGLILEIFGERARTREGELQVELAHLNYQRSRLVRSWTHLERQRGGYGFLGGPGERQIETDRRIIANRIAQIRRELEGVRKTRRIHRRRRQRAGLPVVALVGYTNAGKSTMFNRLTDASVTAQDMLFATLDPTMRAIELPGGHKAILSDTVGFIADLPTHLVAAFRATLEEVLAADIILHVRDASHPESEAQAADVYGVLADLGLDPGDAEGPPVIEALNKIDLMPAQERQKLVNRAARSSLAVPVSAVTGEGLEALQAQIEELLGAGDEIVEVDLGPEEGARLSWLYDNGEVLEQDVDEAGRIHLAVRLDPVACARLSKAREGEG